MSGKYKHERQYIRDMDAQNKYLNDQWNDGWEFVAVDYINGLCMNKIFIFKRWK